MKVSEDGQHESVTAGYLTPIIIAELILIECGRLKDFVAGFKCERHLRGRCTPDVTRWPAPRTFIWHKLRCSCSEQHHADHAKRISRHF